MPQLSAKALDIVLASSSPYRKAQLEKRLGLTISCHSPAISEEPISGESPLDLALRLSCEKAKAVASRLKRASLVIAGDQSAAFNGELLRKPGNMDNAFRDLRRFSGNTVEFYSGICVLNTDSGDYKKDVITTAVTFRELSDAQITAYLHYDQPWDCVGAFKNESLGISLFTGVSSTDPSALTGLPLISLTRLLAEFGVDVLVH